MIHNKISLDISSEQLADIRQQMLKFAQLQLQDIALAEDMVQEAFVNAIKNIDNFQRKAALKTWIFAILKNKIIDYLRKKDRIVLESDLADDDEENHFFDNYGHWKEEYYPSSWQEEAVYSKEFWILFEVCLSNLPAKQARVFMMREYLEATSDEICRVVNITSDNLYTLIYRARLQLQQCLSRKLTERNR
ncbi:TPA: sigma-70 family RNA polymerase sigma factor [Mannheimia haemolytica]|uniref:Sigma-24 n=3 Tax=Mannheimia haemolytica TaxID=75985 RepID=A0A248ZXY8_MANHA|nr:sigma-70 family RNA polymerase sigma factor [Mannheimia haemolytica]AWW70493.1 RNA polymerase subunit sigma [Pasteurellaceae bacterium 12565]AGI31536.1 RNA polymerase subunit sigma [Mannheimia haemolytica USDA-ARS-USMARC-183]AGK00823.1 RNA polymerase sigma-70 factor [Mannheimia haemolytica M42548]AGQ25666.1 RNA polymerase sigma factor [Mannheimia haemolytica D153]AGQ41220.1 RNA polymerase sigma factor [Mannheimia haemolytica D174]